MFAVDSDVIFNFHAQLLSCDMVAIEQDLRDRATMLRIKCLISFTSISSISCPHSRRETIRLPRRDLVVKTQAEPRRLVLLVIPSYIIHISTLNQARPTPFRSLNPFTPSQRQRGPWHHAAWAAESPSWGAESSGSRWHEQRWPHAGRHGSRAGRWRQQWPCRSYYDD